MAKLILKNSPVVRNTQLSLRDFYAKRNKVLVIRGTGGLGDIFMSRMIFEDFKRIMPDAYVVYALPAKYHEAVQGHPFIDEVVDYTKINPNDYLISYDITTICGRHEMSVAPFSDKNRSDIWAHHCGIELQNHNMHFQIDDDLTKECRSILESYRDGESGPLILFAPISAMVSKNLDEPQMNGVLQGLKERNCLVLGFHKTNVEELKAPTVCAKSINQYLAFVKAADAIVSVDTGTFHAAGGLKKPLVGVFSWADSTTYGKYYDFVPVQKHRNWTPGWNCGPCYKWGDCIKCKTSLRKPCITEITAEDVLNGIDKMLQQWDL